MKVTLTMEAGSRLLGGSFSSASIEVPDGSFVTVATMMLLLNATREHEESSYDNTDSGC